MVRDANQWTQATMPHPRIVDVRFEHYAAGKTALGVHETMPRISWRFADVAPNFGQTEYELEVTRSRHSEPVSISTTSVVSDESNLVPWPQPEAPLTSRETCSVRVRAWGYSQSNPTPWSEPAVLEVGLLHPEDWTSNVISAPWASANPDIPQPEALFRKEFSIPKKSCSARLYITALGVYELEVNGTRVGDYFLGPGWTSYQGQLQYQTYDVKELLAPKANCLAVRVAGGWYKGRLLFSGGRQNIWGSRTALLAQLEVRAHDGTTYTMGTDGTWRVTQGPIRQAELYDGEVYDARAEIPDWSRLGLKEKGNWEAVEVLPPLRAEKQLVSGSKPVARPLETIKPIQILRTPSTKLALDFGQIVVGSLRVRNIRAPAGHSIVLQHAEVLKDGELSLQPLRTCKARDIYRCKGNTNGETYEPRFTFHRFRYAQIDGWADDAQLCQSVEAVVCGTDMEEVGDFSCSDPKVSQLFSNIRESMKGNMSYPQRDERLRRIGELALFASTATLVYDCFGTIKDWLRNLTFDQQQREGLPPIRSPDIDLDAPWPCVIWHNLTVLAPWALWEETKDVMILEQQYQSMCTWIAAIPEDMRRHRHLWDPVLLQFAVRDTITPSAKAEAPFSRLNRDRGPITDPLQDCLNPNEPSTEPQKALTDPALIGDAFLIKSLTVMSQAATILGHREDAEQFHARITKARIEFAGEYVTPSGRLVSDSQTAYALAICFELVSPQQAIVAGNRLAEIVQANRFRIETGLAGIPFIYEALARTGHVDTAYQILLNDPCPSWLYPITTGATNIWERWDSIRAYDSPNPREMTSFNHYVQGGVCKFLFERLAGLQRVSAGWRRSRVHPLLGGGFKSASASHITAYGIVSCCWSLFEEEGDPKHMAFNLDVVVPPTTTMEVVIPIVEGNIVRVVGSGHWSFSSVVRKEAVV